LDFEFLVLRLFAATDAVPNAAVAVTAAAAATDAVTNAAVTKAAAATDAAVDGAIESDAVRVFEAANLLKIWQNFYLAIQHIGDNCCKT
jgi:hypothetical protein